MVLEIVVEDEVKQNTKDAEHTDGMNIKGTSAHGFPRLGFGHIEFGLCGKKIRQCGHNSSGKR